MYMYIYIYIYIYHLSIYYLSIYIERCVERTAQHERAHTLASSDLLLRVKEARAPENLPRFCASFSSAVSSKIDRAAMPCRCSARCEQGCDV